VALEFNGLSPTNYYVSEEMMTSAVLLEDSGYVVAGDTSGSLRLFLPRNKQKKLSEILKKNVYKATHISDLAEQRRHKTEVVLIKASKNGTDVFSADRSGRILSWQIISRKSAFELSPMNYLDLDTEVSFLALNGASNVLYAGCQGTIYEFSSSITPSTPTTARSTQNSTSLITSMFATSLDIMIVGYSSGDIRLFIDIHKDSVLKLPAASDRPVLLVFPGNYAKADKISKRIIVQECLASIHALDDRGRLFIYDIEEKIDKPDKTIDLIAEDGPFTILNCQ
jgi:hypothetical protein